ncbi:MAG: DUF4157 domain-containing protein, partial [Myxococcales bacterium]|nr:DUF4157 domain-containing protein [Myxococcales bacterium]
MYAAKSDIRAAAPTSAPNHAAADARRGLQLRAARDHASFEAQERALSPAAGGVQGAASEGVRGASAPLPHLAAIQASFGRHDVSGVRAQVGGPAAAASRAIGASAYATGDRVGFSGGPSLHTAAHEAAHVV